ncbi:hypothetical protein KCH_26300 [Kitasatospora cheerisanensis KCTC 2395]|uniref:Uncharacterized protein n=1 Tax=Kitasatospora cheerisanensis KCTC 2395 TaxID=1348663 RepID=A0A066YVP7_9ACTN|nr:hypothetical protein KCH_26300 [Kitasatospora cheerisanensis KCTC 2395]
MQLSASQVLEGFADQLCHGDSPGALSPEHGDVPAGALALYGPLPGEVRDLARAEAGEERQPFDRGVLGGHADGAAQEPAGLRDGERAGVQPRRPLVRAGGREVAGARTAAVGGGGVHGRALSVRAVVAVGASAVTCRSMAAMGGWCAARWVSPAGRAAARRVGASLSGWE